MNKYHVVMASPDTSAKRSIYLNANDIAHLLWVASDYVKENAEFKGWHLHSVVFHSTVEPESTGKQYAHAYTLAFSVITNDPEGNATPAQFREALMRRVFEIDKLDQWEEACEPPFGTFEVDE